MDNLTVMLLALGMTAIGEFKGIPIFRLASAGLFMFLAFDSQSPLIMIPLIGVSIWQFYKTFFGGEF